MCCVSHRRQSLFAESRRRSIIRTCPKEAVLGSVYWWYEMYQLLCSCSSSVLFHTNSICECVIINYNYNTAHKSSLIPLLVFIMVQHPWQTPLVYKLTESSAQIRYIHLFLNKIKCVLYYHTFWCLTKYLDNMLFVRLKNDTHAQYHQIIGSQIGRVRKKRFSVQYRWSENAATGSWLENENRSVRSARGSLLVLIISSLFTAVHSVYCLSKLITLGYGLFRDGGSGKHIKKVNNWSNLWISVYWRRKHFKRFGPIWWTGSTGSLRRSG